MKLNKRIQLNHSKLLAFRNLKLDAGLSEDTLGRVQGAMVGGKPAQALRAVIGAKAGVKPAAPVR